MCYKWVRFNSLQFSLLFLHILLTHKYGIVLYLGTDIIEQCSSYFSTGAESYESQIRKTILGNFLESTPANV